MLALMPQCPPIPDFYTNNSRASGTMSLAILPSSFVGYSQQGVPSLPSPSKRPKLSLNTSSVNPILGKASTSLRLETLSATSPTVRNTFRNRQNGDQTPVGTSKKPLLTPLTTNVPAVPTQTPTQSMVELPKSADIIDVTPLSALSTASVSTIDSLSSEIPYKLPYNAASILTNGPIARTQSRRLSFAQSRPMFPAAKKVAFASSLTEEITTTKYTLRHSDIESSANSTPEISPVVEKFENEQEGAALRTPEHKKLSSLRITAKPDSWRDEEDNESVPVTPVAGRRKRDREWVWTLRPVPGNEDTSSDIDRAF